MSCLRPAAALLALGMSAGLGACTRYDYTGSLGIRPAAGNLTNTGQALLALPPAPAAPLNVAVYEFQDLTGQNKSSVKAGFPEFSRAITQGASVILVDALKTAGNGCWFTVVDRGHLDNLLRERKLIQDTYAFLKRDPKDLIDPLKFAEYLITGGVVSYDSPVSSAGANVLYAGYGGGITQSKDLVTVNLQVVRVKDGVVVTTINVSRPIVNVSGTASVTRLLGGRILDAQVLAGLQEAVQTAVREAIEVGVYELVRQGDQRRLWLRKVVPTPTPAPEKKAAVPAPQAAAEPDHRTRPSARPRTTAADGPGSGAAGVAGVGAGPRAVATATPSVDAMTGILPPPSYDRTDPSRPVFARLGFGKLAALQ